MVKQGVFPNVWLVLCVLIVSGFVLPVGADESCSPDELENMLNAGLSEQATEIACAEPDHAGAAYIENGQCCCKGYGGAVVYREQLTAKDCIEDMGASCTNMSSCE